jgi:zinc protease
VLDGYDNARLPATLVRTDRIANSVNAGYAGLGRGPALFMLSGAPAKDSSVEKLEAALRAGLQKIAKEGVSNEELKRVKAQVIAGQIYKRDSVYGQAMEIGSVELSGISHKQIDRMIERLSAITPQQVQAVAQKYFSDDQLTVATLIPLPLSAQPERTPEMPGLRH